jgi:hypothetical protein
MSSVATLGVARAEWNHRAVAIGDIGVIGCHDDIPVHDLREFFLALGRTISSQPANFEVSRSRLKSF